MFGNKSTSFKLELSLEAIWAQCICSYLLITLQVDMIATHAQITANLAAPIEQQDSGSWQGNRTNAAAGKRTGTDSLAMPGIWLLPCEWMFQFRLDDLHRQGLHRIFKAPVVQGVLFLWKPNVMYETDPNSFIFGKIISILFENIFMSFSSCRISLKRRFSKGSQKGCT